MISNRALTVFRQPTASRFNFSLKNGESDLIDSQFSALKKVFFSNISAIEQTHELANKVRLDILCGALNDLRGNLEDLSDQVEIALRGFKSNSVTTCFAPNDKILFLEDLFKIASPFSSVRDNIQLLSRYIGLGRVYDENLDENQLKFGRFRFKDVSRLDIFCYLSNCVGSNRDLFIVVNGNKNIDLIDGYRSALNRNCVFFALIVI